MQSYHAVSGFGYILTVMTLGTLLWPWHCYHSCKHTERNTSCILSLTQINSFDIGLCQRINKEHGLSLIKMKNNRCINNGVGGVIRCSKSVCLCRIVWPLCTVQAYVVADIHISVDDSINAAQSKYVIGHCYVNHRTLRILGGGAAAKTKTLLPFSANTQLPSRQKLVIWFWLISYNSHTIII